MVWIATFFILITYANGSYNETQFERNINIPTKCGLNGTRDETCPLNRGVCTINPLANDVWKTEAFCACKPGFYGENCEYGPFCQDLLECSGNGLCIIHKYQNSSYGEKCVCNEGYFGSDCSNNPCSVLTCENSGICCGVTIPEGTYSAYCKCPSTHLEKGVSTT